jgi:hypothetical protein
MIRLASSFSHMRGARDYQDVAASEVTPMASGDAEPTLRRSIRASWAYPHCPRGISRKAGHKSIRRSHFTTLLRIVPWRCDLAKTLEWYYCPIGAWAL